MLTVITDAAGLAAAQQQLGAQLQAALNQTCEGTVAGPGGGFAATLHYGPALDLRHGYQAQGHKHFNGFGTGAPLPGKKMSLAAEINFPVQGLSRALSGVFARNEQGRIHVLHRGKIRGGKALFFEHYQGRQVEADDGGRPDTFALIGTLDDAGFPQQMRDFVQEILRIKAAAK